MRMIKHILVGYDGSESSLRALRLAMELAGLSGGRVRAVMVLQVIKGADTGSILMTDSGEMRARELLAELTANAPADAPLLDVEVVHGSPGDVLLAQVTQHGIDHIVIGHSGQGALARWLLGSVSDDVLSRAHVPVTVVR